LPEDFLKDEDEEENVSSPEVEFEEDDRFGEDEIPFDAEIDDKGEEGEETLEDLEDISKEGEEKEDEDENFDYFEDDEKIVLTYYKTGEEDLEEPDEKDEFSEKDLEDEDEDKEKEKFENEPELEEVLDRPTEPTRKFDFKDKGRPGLRDVKESLNEQALDLTEDEEEGAEEIESDNKINKRYRLRDGRIVDVKPSGEIILVDDEKRSSDFRFSELNRDQKRLRMYPEDNEDEDIVEESKQPKTKLEQIIENIKAARAVAKLNETDPQPDEKDELKDADLKKIGSDEEEVKKDEDELDLDLDKEEGEDEVEKVEITEFIITVEDDLDTAIDELKELGITAQRVPLEPKEEEIPAPVEEPEEEKPVDNIPEEPKEEKSVKEGKESLTEAEDDEKDLGTSDELSLGDQGEDAKELDLGDEDKTVEPTTEFEENKLRVKAEDWPILKGWLEDKGVDVKEMFGGDIEMEEVPEEGEEEETKGEISDDDVDFTGIGDSDKTKVLKESFIPEKYKNLEKNEIAEEIWNIIGPYSNYAMEVDDIYAREDIRNEIEKIENCIGTDIDAISDIDLENLSKERLIKILELLYKEDIRNFDGEEFI